MIILHFVLILGALNIFATEVEGQRRTNINQSVQLKSPNNEDFNPNEFQDYNFGQRGVARNEGNGNRRRRQPETKDNPSRSTVPREISTRQNTHSSIRTIQSPLTVHNGSRVRRLQATSNNAFNPGRPNNSVTINSNNNIRETTAINQTVGTRRKPRRKVRKNQDNTISHQLTINTAPNGDIPNINPSQGHVNIESGPTRKKSNPYQGITTTQFGNNDQNQPQFAEGHRETENYLRRGKFSRNSSATSIKARDNTKSPSEPSTNRNFARSKTVLNNIQNVIDSMNAFEAGKVGQTVQLGNISERTFELKSRQFLNQPPRRPRNNSRNLVGNRKRFSIPILPRQAGSAKNINSGLRRGNADNSHLNTRRVAASNVNRKFQRVGTEKYEPNVQVENNQSNSKGYFNPGALRDYVFGQSDVARNQGNVNRRRRQHEKTEAIKDDSIVIAGAETGTDMPPGIDTGTENSLVFYSGTENHLGTDSGTENTTETDTVTESPSETDTGAENTTETDTVTENPSETDTGAEIPPGTESTDTGTEIPLGTESTHTGAEIPLGTESTDTRTEIPPRTNTGTEISPGTDTGTEISPGTDTGTEIPPGMDSGTEISPGTESTDTGAEIPSGTESTDTRTEIPPGTSTGTEIPPGTNTETEISLGTDTGTETPGTDIGTEIPPGTDAGSEIIPPGTDAESEIIPPATDTGSEKIPPGTDADTNITPGIGKDVRPTAEPNENNLVDPNEREEGNRIIYPVEWSVRGYPLNQKSYRRSAKRNSEIEKVRIIKTCRLGYFLSLRTNTCIGQTGRRIPPAIADRLKRKA